MTAGSAQPFNGPCRPDERGGGKTRIGVDYAVAGMRLVELALQRKLDVHEDDRVSVLDSSPVGVGFPDAGRKQVKDRMEEISEGGCWVRGPVKQAVRRTRVVLARAASQGGNR